MVGLLRCRTPFTPEESIVRRGERRMGFSRKPGPRLCPRPADAIEIVEPRENVAWLRPVGWAEDPRRMELINDPCRATVADFQAPLQQ